MSRIGKLPIIIPAEVKVEVKDSLVRVIGPKGELVQLFRPEVKINLQNGQLTITRNYQSKLAKALHGLTRTLIANMIVGVTQGWEKELEVVGTGFRVLQAGEKLVFSLGFSHPVEFKIPAGLSVEINQNKVKISGADKAVVGQFAQDIRRVKPPDPYKGKGIRYLGEQVKLRPGKKAAVQTGW